ncbi:MAG: hypothetical protein RR135_01655 [Oscillospiraceae bacterium]
MLIMKAEQHVDDFLKVAAQKERAMAFWIRTFTKTKCVKAICQDDMESVVNNSDQEGYFLLQDSYAP